MVLATRVKKERVGTSIYPPKNRLLYTTYNLYFIDINNQNEKTVMLQYYLKYSVYKNRILKM